MVQGKKTRKNFDLGQNNLIDSLLAKGGGKKTKISSQKYEPPQKPKKQVSFTNIPPTPSSSNKLVKSNNKTQIINNFHKAISSTNSDEVILKMLDLKEKDIIVFYKNLENLIGKDMSSKIKNEMAGQLQASKFASKGDTNISICPFCMENKTNCVILLCGHLLCSKCAKNINRCKYPCPKCKKPIKYIQYIANS
jgi:hypothetical protein